MNNTPSDRELNRQNKAATLVNAVLLSNVVTEGLETIIKIIQTSLTFNDTNDVGGLKNNLNSIYEISQILLTNNHASINKYCRCATYVKKKEQNQ
jgi:deoxyxylulose-5-phosphate synthase